MNLKPFTYVCKIDRMGSGNYHIWLIDYSLDPNSKYPFQYGALAAYNNEDSEGEFCYNEETGFLQEYDGDEEFDLSFHRSGSILIGNSLDGESLALSNTIAGAIGQLIIQMELE